MLVCSPLESNGELSLEKVVTLKQNGSVQVTVDLPTDQEINSVTYTVLETDKDGNPVDDDTFKYTVTGQGEVTLNNDNRYTVTKEITNSLSSEPTPIRLLHLEQIMVEMIGSLRSRITVQRAELLRTIPAVQQDVL